jgi:hypothetical protein
METPLSVSKRKIIEGKLENLSAGLNFQVFLL